VKKLIFFLILVAPLLVRGQLPDHLAAVNSQLQAINCSAPVTYRTNRNLVDCTVHCRDLAERDAVYNAFRNVKKSALTSTRVPPTVCVVFSREDTPGTKPAGLQSQSGSPATAAGTNAFGLSAPEKEKLLAEILTEYHKSHTYIPEGIYQCVEMAADVWNQVQTRGIPAKVKIGNIEKVITSLLEANHAWVMAEVSQGQWLALETTGGAIVPHSQNPRYYESPGKVFSTPRALKEYQTLLRDYNQAAAKFNAAADDYNQILDRYKSSNWYVQRTLNDQLNSKDSLVRTRKADVEEIEVKLKQLLQRE
jgi:hypothetical protein